MLAKVFANVPARIGRIVRVVGLGSFVGLVLGYAVFYTTFPNASVPPSGEPNPLFTFGTIFAAAILVGILSEDLLAGILQAFVALPAGATIASVLALSPVLGGLVVSRPDDVIFFTLRTGFPLFFASIPIMIVSTVVGIVLQEKLRLGRY